MLDHQKPIIAFDVDDVLRDFLRTLARWWNQNDAEIRGRFSHNLRPRPITLSDFHDEAYYKTWGEDLDTAIEIVRYFYTSAAFLSLRPNKSAVQFVQKVYECGWIPVAITACYAGEEITRVFIQESFGTWINSKEGLFFSGLNLVEGGGKETKLDVCKRIGAAALIDNSPRNLLGCSENGIIPILWNPEGAYEWINDHLPDPESGIMIARSFDEAWQYMNEGAPTGIENGF